MTAIGLTGGIGAGKSFVADEFARLGAQVVDADLLARAVTAAGEPVLETIRARFGEQALLTDGQLNRAWLRDVIFRQPSQKSWLEALLHPLVRARITAQLAQPCDSYHLLVSPLLFETGQTVLVSRVIVVDVDETTQLERACLRDGADPAAVRRIMDSQLSRTEKLARADYIVDNNGSRDATIAQVEALHRSLLTLNH